MVGRRLIVWLLWLLPVGVAAQEVLTPLLMRPAAAPVPSKAPLAPVSLPFFDDFASGHPSAALWQPEGGACVSLDVSPLAPTVGVLTLDALDASGRLHGAASTAVFPADTATSAPLRLDGLVPGDSVVVSFYYLPGGGYGPMWERMGYAPDPQDTLFLDFYCAADSAWRTVWYRCGTSVDTLLARTGRGWQYAAVAVEEQGCFDSLFRFRFRNYASLENTPKAGKAGNCDYWHIDYVCVDRGRSVAAEPAVRDLAFASPAPSMLRRYRAMPYRQYLPSEMVTSLHLDITNRYSSELASHYTYSVADSLGHELYAYDGGFENAPPFMPDGSYQTAPGHASPPVGYAFPPMDGPAAYTVTHVVREGAGGDDYTRNDTLRYVQRFADQYAYDDGTPENGYSLTSTAATVYLAYRFDLNVSDTLTAVDLCFNATLADANLAIPFRLTLWSVGGDGRPDAVLYRDHTRRLPQVGGYVRYVLERGVVVDGPLFVGFEQEGNDFINLGFDRSHNSSDRIYYLTDTNWRQSFLSGSLMLRPCFGAGATVGVAVVDDPVEVGVYPNPASESVTLRGEVAAAELYDLRGRRLMALQCPTWVLPLAAYPSGVYLLRLVSRQGGVQNVKLIIKH